MAEEVDAWVVDSLAKLLFIQRDEVTESLVPILKSLHSTKDINQYLKNLLGDSSEATQFITDYHIKRKSFKKNNTSTIETKKNSKEPKNQMKGKNSKNVKPFNHTPPARPTCTCQGSLHDVFTNCLNCGRILCQSEGPGICSFCGKDVLSPAQQLTAVLGAKANSAPASQPKNKPSTQERLNGMYSYKLGGNAASSIQYYPELGQEGPLEFGNPVLPKDLEDRWTKALELKNRLLDYDRKTAERTRVIDEKSDFVSSTDAVNLWASPVEREKTMNRIREKEKMEEGRKKISITFDISNRMIVSSQPEEAFLDLALQEEKANSTHILEFTPPLKKGEIKGQFSENPFLLTRKPKLVPISMQENKNTNNS